MSALRSAVFAGLSLIAGVANGYAADVAHCKGVLYVSVRSDRVAVNGHDVDMAVLNQSLAELKPSSNFVLYYRENSQTMPNPAQQVRIKRVLDAIVRLRLPVSMSSKADFSDSIDENGASQPRTTCPTKA